MTEQPYEPTDVERAESWLALLQVAPDLTEDKADEVMAGATWMKTEDGRIIVSAAIPRPVKTVFCTVIVR